MGSEGLVRERPILFSAPMVRALLEGRKAQTRRICKDPLGPSMADDCPLGEIRDRLWVVQIKAVPFADGRFGVGDDGNVYRIDGIQPRRMRPRLSHNGYEEITLKACGEERAFRVNRLVCEAFYGPAPTDGLVCRHLDNNRRNNLPENLDWGTPEQNSADANACGSWSGQRNGAAKLSCADVQAIRASQERQDVIAKRHGITQPTVSKIKNGFRWRTQNPDAPRANFPRWASRITLEITDVRVERLNDISEADARAEGCVLSERCEKCGSDDWPEFHRGYRDAYRCLWGSINGEGSWSKNDWVWVVSFRRLTPESAEASR